MPTAFDNRDSKAEGPSLSDFTRNDSCHSSSVAIGRRELLPLLVQRIQQLPARAKKILAMYYCERLEESEIAIHFRLSEWEVDQIRMETVDRLNDYLKSIESQALGLADMPDKPSE